MRAPTLKDVARQEGVGIATVSTINGGSSATRVSAATRQRILEVAAELRYHPNAMARGLRNRKSRTVGVLYDSEGPFLITHNPHASAVMEGILTTGREAGYNVLTFTSRWQDAATSAPLFRDQMTDGILVVAPRRGSDVVRGLASLGIPVVTVSGPSGEAEIPWVDVDHAQGAALAADHLVSLGHTRIAYLAGDPSIWASHRRGEAFWRRLAVHGVRYRPEYAVTGAFNLHETQEIMRGFLALPERPTAVFAMNDQMAMCVMAAAREVGLRVPEDLSVVGFDDIPLCEYLVPRLTTVQHPMVEVGQVGMKLLLQRLDGTVPEDAGREVPAALVARDSTAPVAPA
jgi:LacI family transcriptional regulator